MQADFSVELGREDEALELPWAAASGPRYYDLKQHPELLAEIEEARTAPELGEFLSAVNSQASILETAKCDAWPSTEFNAEEEVFGAACKFCSYVDLLFSASAARFSFAGHEGLARRLVDLLKLVPEIPAAAELIIRRCVYHQGPQMRDGLYLTLYVSGYGDDEQQARRHWAIGLKLVENAVRQISAESRR